MKKMNIQTCIYILAILFVSITLPSCGNKKSDEQLQQDVQEKLFGDGQENNTAYAGVNATVNDGVLTLSGECEGDNCADSVMSRVEDVEGVKSVVNNIKQIQAQTDYTLRTSVQSIISKYAGVQADVANGIVVLRGNIQREQIQPLMNELSTLQAKKIDNQLAIQ